MYEIPEWLLLQRLSGAAKDSRAGADQAALGDRSVTAHPDGGTLRKPGPPYRISDERLLATSVQYWLELKDQRDEAEAQMKRMAQPLEDRAADLGEGFAELVGVDSDGRVRFTVKGFGQRTFSLEELAG